MAFICPYKHRTDGSIGLLHAEHFRFERARPLLCITMFRVAFFGQRVESGKTSKIGHFSAYDWGKRIKERRRHIIIDTCANLIAREFHTADSQVQLLAFLGSSL